jgi:hypothetical protein
MFFLRAVERLDAKYAVGFAKTTFFVAKYHQYLSFTNKIKPPYNRDVSHEIKQRQKRKN